MRLGIDLGSSTIKTVLFDNSGKLLYSYYKRHRGQVRSSLVEALKKIDAKERREPVSVAMTGTAALKTAEYLDIPFIQEVKALSSWVSKKYPEAGGIVEMGGEDAKFVLLGKEKNPLMKMNGNCAGGTGSFIEQMARLFNVTLEEFELLAQKSGQTVPIASRCGVFAKTDIQALFNQGYSRQDLAGSVFQAVANQYTASLMQGLYPEGELILGGGPLTHFPSLRNALSGILPYPLLLAENSLFLSAMGTAYQDKDAKKLLSLDQFIAELESSSHSGSVTGTEKPLFTNRKQYEEFSERQSRYTLPFTGTIQSDEPLFMGIDAGSTTTKFVIINQSREIAASFYASNDADSMETLRKGLLQYEKLLAQVKTVYVTGYGRYLCREAFNLSGILVETAAHYIAGSEFRQDIDFVLDIGGQDIKAMQVQNYVVTDFYLNEACSSGTGSFLENFAANMKMSLEDFIEAALFAPRPASLGTRCTVFMNSKIKDALNDGIAVGNIAAGLAYSVVKNALYKVIRIRDIRQLGDTILVQGGTFKNDAVLRAFELLTDSEVICVRQAHLMGAYGTALHALEQSKRNDSPSWDASRLSLESSPVRIKKVFQCHGCGNNCDITSFTFKNDHRYLTGNKCEKPLALKNNDPRPAAINFFDYKYSLCYQQLINEAEQAPSQVQTREKIGLPLVLAMFEHFPFFYTLLSQCGFEVVVSHWTTDRIYKQGLRTQLSENLCFPAKIIHGHIEELIHKKVDRILLPMICFENLEDKKAVNTFNCPVVTGYPEVIESLYREKVAIDKPLISFFKTEYLHKTAWRYMKSLGVDRDCFKKAFIQALSREKSIRAKYIQKGKELAEYARSENLPLIVVGGRSYHIDPLIHHGILPLISSYNAVVINEEVGAALAGDVLDEVEVITQWTYHNRLYKSALWLRNLQYPLSAYIQLNSFGCGPDAVTTDEVHDLLKHSHVPYICIKLDEMSTLGAASIRVESLLYALQYQGAHHSEHPSFTKPVPAIIHKKPKILVPYLADIYSEVINTIFESFGYEIIIPSGQNYENVEEGLRSVNNDMCYPAMIVVGDILATLQEQKVQPVKDDVIIALSRTGGQCRASNYVAVLKKALRDNGYSEIPVVTLSTYGALDFLKINRYQLLKKASMGFLLADCIQSMVLSTRPYEKEKGAANALLQKAKTRLQIFIAGNPNRRTMRNFLQELVNEFNAVPVIEKRYPQVGVVGEIYLKMNSFANNHLVNWLESKGYEAVVPGFIHFLEMDFYSHRFNWFRHLKKDLNKLALNSLKKFFFEYYRKSIHPVMKEYKRLQPEFEISEGLNDNIVSMGIQFGEAWLLPMEIMMLYRKGVRHVVSVQPFGCISNHIISKGLQKKIRDSFPGLQFLTLDYESGSTNVHIANRLALFFQ